MRLRFARSLIAVLTVLGLLLGAIALPAAAVQETATPEAATPEASPIADVTPTGTVDLDVLFIGAHPDDEAGRLAAYGQWNEFAGVEVGVITVTRGEGGGNAVGTEEGPALGLLREGEERTAVGMAGIEHVYYLDKVDFYYNLSAPLTIETWGYEETLERVVRVVRATQPEVIITMDPSPNTHGHHQVAARLAIDAFYTAADPDRFPEQISDEGYTAWTVGSIYRNNADVEDVPGPDCATTFVPEDPADVNFGVWEGTESEANGGRTWGEIERDAQRTYASQGWAVFPDAPTDPAGIECDFFSLIDSRVPISPNASSTTALLENAVLPQADGLPLGTQFSLTASSYDVAAGEPFILTAQAEATAETDLTGASVVLAVPDGWEFEAAGDPVVDGSSLTQEFTVMPAADAEPGVRSRIAATLSAGGLLGSTVEVVRVMPAVSGVLAPRPDVAEFQEWTEATGVPHLARLIEAFDAIAVGETRGFDVVVTNNSAEPQSGTVTLELPAGFEAESASQDYADLAPGESTTVTFTITNTGTSLPTANEGGEEGNYAFTIVTESNDGSSTQPAALNLVPATLVGPASPDLAVDGVISEGEYTGEALDLSRLWEGEDPESAEDASGTAWLAWDEGGIYVAVEVVDDTLGTVLTPEDAKRHWRTDSVEIAIDPLGTSSNTSTTFKVGVFPTSTDGNPQAYRDADAHQGPVSETAPGFEVASTLNEPYTGYVIETFIPFDALPADLDPNQAAMNIFIYDSDTQDLTGQTRLGWSTFGGVQAETFRWGRTTFVDEIPADTASPIADGATPAASPVVEPATPVAGAPDVPIEEVVDTTVDEPIMPLDVAQSTLSPMSIQQSAADGVGLGGRPKTAEGEGLTFLEDPVLEGGTISMQYTSGSANGVMTWFLVDGDGNVLYEDQRDIEADQWHGSAAGTIPEVEEATLLVSFETEDGAVQALALPVTIAG